MSILGPILGGVAGSLVGGLFNKGRQSGSTYTTQNTTSSPWSGVQPYLTDLFGRAQTQSNTGISPLMNQYLGTMQNRATTGNPLNSLAQSQNAQTLQGDFLRPESNPYLQSTVNRALGDVTSKINSQFTGDNFGGSAHQEWLQRGLADTALPYYMQNYQQERQRQLGAQALAPTLANQDYTDIDRLGGAARYQQDFPWNQLQQYQQLISGQGGGSTSGGTTSPYYTNPYSNMLGGALGGLGLYNAMNQSGLFGGSTGYNPTPSFYGQDLGQPDFSGGFY